MPCRVGNIRYCMHSTRAWWMASNGCAVHSNQRFPFSSHHSTHSVIFRAHVGSYVAVLACLDAPRRMEQWVKGTPQPQSQLCSLLRCGFWRLLKLQLLHLTIRDENHRILISWGGHIPLQTFWNSLGCLWCPHEWWGRVPLDGFPGLKSGMLVSFNRKADLQH